MPLRLGDGTGWLYFPILYRDLPLDTVVGLTVYSPAVPAPHVLGGTTFFLFTSKGQLKRGLRKYLLHEGQVRPPKHCGIASGLPSCIEILLPGR